MCRDSSRNAAIRKSRLETRVMAPNARDVAGTKDEPSPLLSTKIRRCDYVPAGTQGSGVRNASQAHFFDFCARSAHVRIASGAWLPSPDQAPCVQGWDRSSLQLVSSGPHALPGTSDGHVHRDLSVRIVVHDLEIGEGEAVDVVDGGVDAERRERARRVLELRLEGFDVIGVDVGVA